MTQANQLSDNINVKCIFVSIGQSFVNVKTPAVQEFSAPPPGPPEICNSPTTAASQAC